MLKIILLSLLAIVVIFVIVVAMQPEDFKVTRSATIAAPAATVFAQVNDFHKWEAWSPWAKIDPNSKATYSGPESGPGASFAWAGNNEVGEGRMTIKESQPNDRILVDLQFIKPFAANNLAEFTFKPQGDQTQVTWTMSGKNNFMFKAFSLFMNCDKMVGPQFEKGLASMKAIAEAKPAS
jgi:hypothetical protein